MTSHESNAEPAWRDQYPFEPNWCELPAGRLHYLDEGPAEPTGTLLFVHGNPTWSFHWREAVTHFAGTHRCVALDHLGCGLSDKPQQAFRLADRIDHLVRFVDECDLRDVTLVAQDWGGAIGLGAMLRRVERLRGVVLLNTGAFPPPLFPLRIRVCRTPVLGRLALQGANLFSRAALRMTTTRSGLPADVAAGYLAPYDSWSNRRAVYEFVADIPASPAHPTWRVLEEIEAGLATLSDLPSLLVWGMRDWCFTPACLERFRAAWPRAEVLEIADAGHWVMEDARDEVLDAMSVWMARRGSSSQVEGASA